MARRVTDLERMVREMAGARTLENSTLSQGGVAVTQGGSVRVVDIDGTVIAIIGALPSPEYDRLDGTPQPGMALYREDGSLAVLLGDGSPTLLPYKQAFQLKDRAGNTVISDDTNSGTGLARPHVPASAMRDSNVATWPATTAVAWTSIADCYMEVQNPRLQWAINIQADAATTGEYKLSVNGTQVGTTQTVTAGIAFWSPLSEAMPAGVDLGDIVTISLQAQVTAGVGTVRATCRWMTGMQS
jgi:hypothetical protein